MNGAQFLVQALKKQGVTQVFGYPGGAIMPVYDALYDGGLAHQLCRHEQGAAMAAVGYARASGQVGVCIATSGPGATNLVTGLAEALLDSVPLVAISGQVPCSAIGTDAFQEVDVLGMSLSCTKHSFMVTDVADLGRVLEEAFAIATEGRPGPVLIDFPKDVQLAAVPAQNLLFAVEEPEALNPAELTLVRTLLAAAERPVLYVGGGVGMANAETQLREFAAVTGMPAVTTLKGIGALDPDSPVYLGMLGMHGTKSANYAVQQCDLLVVVGARFDDRVTGKLEEFAPEAKVIHLDVDAAEFGKRRAAEVGITTDLKRVLPALAMALAIDPWREHCANMAREYAFRYDHPGQPIYAPAQHMRFTSPRNHLSSAGLGTMGFGLPAAIGAKMSRPDDEVVLVSGDGSFMMNVQELGTIRRAQLKVKMVLIDNQRLGMVRQWQELFFDGRYSETILSDNPDFVALAAAFGIPGETITCKDQIAAALDRLLGSEGAYLLHVAISEEENVWPLVPPGVANHKMMEQRP
ncbi:TPA: acetolactate synthase 2 catalytic subunit [Aeromonas salmonicida]|uniref:acetolactate synthase 2 catalytic subunit n=1 Tax=Aeromonas salmonicida TaxID=645 RepID=UPI00044A9A77|nr:acetolactate synthase 2 catalytic subunit [Aeromonas salmonicida]ELI6404713.1 acetolactate synthase 2 catalytic subunit [Aeromonas salmonicida subsp. salmonicida]ASI25143.1 acetolactate synthase 2 catalytic subunit [Aeromonas salmonicida]ASI29462.1 acetolactate synthase 2 catalytic subunit [Aeromonas salmonicida]ASI33593.1 acetolactate synthase 2 catalytic subunit [Aeromonas salmonicida]ELI6435396.1 acetolactate synthase 2 catalytic subunit [Aeromonas salmonicida subsp. salmonicida]